MSRLLFDSFEAAGAGAQAADVALNTVTFTSLGHAATAGAVTATAGLNTVTFESLGHAATAGAVTAAAGLNTITWESLGHALSPGAVAAAAGLNTLTWTALGHEASSAAGVTAVALNTVTWEVLGHTATAGALTAAAALNTITWTSLGHDAATITAAATALNTITWSSLDHAATAGAVTTAAALNEITWTSLGHVAFDPTAVPEGPQGHPANEDGSRAWNSPFAMGGGGGGGGSGGWSDNEPVPDDIRTIEDDLLDEMFADEAAGRAENVVTDEDLAGLSDVEYVVPTVEYAVDYAKKGAASFYEQFAGVMNPHLTSVSFVVPGALAYAGTKIVSYHVGPKIHAEHGQAIGAALAFGALWWATAHPKLKKYQNGARVGSAVALVEILVRRYAPGHIPGSQAAKVKVPEFKGMTFLDDE